jgi:hypothetical protein
MASGRLVHSQQSYVVEIEIDDATERVLEQTSDGSSVDINVTVWKGVAVRLPEVAINPPYENLEVLRADHDVNSIRGWPNGKLGIVQSGTILQINVTVRVEKGGSAFP